MKKTGLILSLLLASLISFGQTTDPMIIGWWFNTTNHMYNGILTDVEAVYYNSQYVYVKSSGVPKYYLDGQSTNNASDLHATWQIPRVPVVATNPTGLQGGQQGLMMDGSVFFHPGDAQSYNNAGVWNRLAYFFEYVDVDASNGHSTPDKMYHHHFDNLELHNFDTTKHSPIVGFAWDGYPVYGPFGYKNVDGTGGTKRITSSYRTKTYTTRTNGPAVGGQYPIGCFQEDWEYATGIGDLDVHNGRFCVTPEYPNGTYAYFTTIDANFKPYYPYFIGSTFYGTYSNVNIGPAGGHNTVPTGATQYIPTTGVDEIAAIEANIALYPIPVVTDLTISVKENKNYKVVLYDLKGTVIKVESINSTSRISMGAMAHGVYFVEVTDVENNRGFIKRIVKM